MKQESDFTRLLLWNVNVDKIPRPKQNIGWFLLESSCVYRVWQFDHLSYQGHYIVFSLQLCTEHLWSRHAPAISKAMKSSLIQKLWRTVEYAFFEYTVDCRFFTLFSFCLITFTRRGKILIALCRHVTYFWLEYIIIPGCYIPHCTWWHWFRYVGSFKL